MLGWKAKTKDEEPPMEATPIAEEEPSTWADGSFGPKNPVSRIYGRLRGEWESEARLATAE
jgi:hypothetical protein